MKILASLLVLCSAVLSSLVAFGGTGVGGGGAAGKTFILKETQLVNLLRLTQLDEIRVYPVQTGSGLPEADIDPELNQVPYTEETDELVKLMQEGFKVIVIVNENSSVGLRSFDVKLDEGALIFTEKKLSTAAEPAPLPPVETTK